ncbi:putative [histone H3]-lysine(4) N-trimethyltransferase chromatin remodeling SET family [Helianthus annuus]|nr:putative [histone H3]-lysine(4) N-trimethyltransferase chromatin remodeling SET family [Helianthus annuus]
MKVDFLAFMKLKRKLTGQHLLLTADPNTHIVWVENVEARLKALREIEAGEELRICYIDASMDRDARQNLLSNGFGFECNCPRCMSND